MNMNFSVVPIHQEGSAGLVSDDALVDVWRVIVAEHKVELVFYGGGVGSPDSFVKMLRSPSIAACMAIDNRTRRPAVIAWLTNVANRSAFAHYCVLGPPRRAAGRAILDFWRSFRDRSGNPAFDVLLGITPDTHVAALRVLRIMGFTSIGTVPRYCDTVYDGRRAGGVISYHEFPTADKTSHAGRHT